MNSFYNSMYPNLYGNAYNQPQQVQVVMVNGIEGARAYPMAANSSAMLLDQTNPLAYIIKTDGAAYKSVSVYDLVPHQEKTPATEFENRLKRLEDAVYGHAKNDTEPADE